MLGGTPLDAWELANCKLNRLHFELKSATILSLSLSLCIRLYSPLEIYYVNKC